jgi:hypothetical protein
LLDPHKSLKANKICIFGRTGTGKSTLIKGDKKLGIESLLNSYNNYVIWDYQGEYLKGFGDVYTDFNTFVDGIKYCLKNKKPIKKVVYFNVNLFDKVCEVMHHVKDCVFVVEEVDAVTTPTYAPPNCDNLNRSSRHWDLSLIWLSQRPRKVYRNLTSNANKIIVFSINEPGDIQYLKDYAGIDPEEIQKLSKENHEKIIKEI